MIIFIEIELCILYEVGKKGKIKIWGRNDNSWVWEIGYVKEMKDYVAFIVEWKPMFVVSIVEWKPQLCCFIFEWKPMFVSFIVNENLHKWVMVNMRLEVGK